jgi:LysM repeat protein
MKTRSRFTPTGFTFYLPALTLVSALILGSPASVNTVQQLSAAQPMVTAITEESVTQEKIISETPESESAPVEIAVQKAPTEPTVDPAVTANAYTISAGDTVSAVAARYGVDLEKMLAANGLTIYSTITPGDVLKFTGPAVPLRSPVPPKPAPSERQVDPAKTTAAATAAIPKATGRVITLSGSGGQGMIDRCAGPIHFTPITQAFSITEHDYCGGWARFSGIQIGETVTITGKGTYKVTGRGVVPNPGDLDDLSSALGGIPPVFLQTCIPGTRTMLVIGLT